MRPPEPPPLLGQHTAEVLAEMGISEDEIDALKARGAVAMPG
jgi:formyl-CoA transferase